MILNYKYNSDLCSKLKSMKVLFFSSIAEITGCKEREIKGFDSVLKFKTQLESEFPGIKAINYSIAVNRAVIHNDLGLNEDDEVALLPPFSGG